MLYAILGLCLTVAVCNWLKWKTAFLAIISLTKEKGCVPTNEEIKAHSIRAVKNLFKTKL